MSSVRCLISVDPGSAGGLAVCLTPATGGAPIISAYAMPQTTQDVVDLIKSAVEGADDVEAFVESQTGVMGPRSPVSAASMFTFGEWYGAILGALAALGVRTTLVRPAKWQNALSLGKSDRVPIPPGAQGEELANLRAQNAAARQAWKLKLKAKAQQLFPGVKVTLKTADALLLLEFGRMMSGATVARNAEQPAKSAWE